MVKNLPVNAGVTGSIPGLGRSPGGGNGYPLQYSCLGNPRDRGPWWAPAMESQRVRPLVINTSTFLPNHKVGGIPQILKNTHKSEESESHSVVSDSLRPRGLYRPWNSPGQNTGVGSPSLLQGIFPTPGSNPGLPHCRQILYQLSHKRSPIL